MKNRILADIAYARSGDKGPNVNVGVILLISTSKLKDSSPE